MSDKQPNAHGFTCGIVSQEAMQEELVQAKRTPIQALTQSDAFFLRIALPHEAVTKPPYETFCSTSIVRGLGRDASQATVDNMRKTYYRNEQGQTVVYFSPNQDMLSALYASKMIGAAELLALRNELIGHGQQAREGAQRG